MRFMRLRELVGLCSVRYSFAVAIFALALVSVASAKFALIASFSGITPYWDQWDAEAAFLYKPYLNDQISFLTLFSPHNEHRIFFSRMLALALLELRGSWDVQFQMLVNATLSVIAVGVLLKFLMQGLGERQRTLLILFSLLVLMVPVGWENTLSGFQSQFHFCFLFSTCAIYFGHAAPAFSKRWFIALGLALAAFFSSASGCLTFVALASLFALQTLIGVRQGSREIAALFVPLVAFVATFGLIPEIVGHNSLKAQGALEFITALSRVLSWPATGVSPLFLIIHAPLLLLATSIVRQRPPITDWRWLIIGIGGWLALQFMSMAYGRAGSPVASRYLDTITIGLLVNCASGLWLIDSGRHPLASRATVAPMIVWLAMVGFTLGVELHGAIRSISNRSAEAANHTRAVSDYLKSGSKLALNVPSGVPPHKVIPYPSSERLAALISDETIRSILPAPLNSAFEPRVVSEKLVLARVFAPMTKFLKRIIFIASWPTFVGSLILAIMLTALKPWFQQESSRVT